MNNPQQQRYHKLHIWQKIKSNYMAWPKGCTSSDRLTMNQVSHGGTVVVPVPEEAVAPQDEKIVAVAMEEDPLLY